MPTPAFTPPRRARPCAFAALLLILAIATPGLAREVQVVAVSPGSSAVLVIDGGPPLELVIGERFEGVELLSSNRNGAVLRIGGVEKRLPLVSYRGSLDGGADSVTLTSEGGHFAAGGVVNGRSVRFIVDTGATITTLSRAQAEGIGLDYRRGAPIQTMTVNGIANGWLVSLDSVQLGHVTVNDVEAIVVDNDALPVGLLGMNFLNRFDMKRQGSTLVLRLRR